MPNICWETGI